MLLLVALVLVILWLLGAFAIHIGGDLIHIILVIAAIVFLYDVFVRRRDV